MKKFIALLLVSALSFTIVACGNSQQTKKEPENTKIENEKSTVKTKTNNKKETEITSGELYNKINSVEKVKSISTIEDTEIGFINLNLSVNVSKGTAMEELESYVKKIAKIQTSLKEYFINKKFLKVTYFMYVDNEMKSVFTVYKKQNGDYTLEDTTIIDEKYKKAAEALN